VSKLQELMQNIQSAVNTVAVLKKGHFVTCSPGIFMVRILVNRSTVKCVCVFVFRACTVQFVRNCPSVLGHFPEWRIP
jgi:hypothetical protein